MPWTAARRALGIILCLWARPLEGALDRGGRRRTLALIDWRGGDLIPTEKDEEIDAYIDQLVASVSDSEEEPVTTLEKKAMKLMEHETAEVKEEEEKEEEATDDEEKEEEEAVAPRLQTVTAPATSEPSKEDSKENKAATATLVEAVTSTHKPKKRAPRRRSANKTRGSDHRKIDIPVSTDDRVKKTPSQKQQTKTTKGGSHGVAPATRPVNELPQLSSPSALPLPSDPSPSTLVATPKSNDSLSNPPPNGFYRFLLRRGRVGHTLVLTMVLSLEWIKVYVPPLFHLLTRLYLRLAPAWIQRPPLPRASSRGLADSRKRVSRSKLARHADALALQQLQQVGNVAQAKYKYCSEAFRQRHGLGIYSDSGSHRQRKEEEAKLISVVSRVLETKSDVGRARPSRREDMKEQDPVDWIMQALMADGDSAVSISSAAAYYDDSLDDGITLSPVDQQRRLIQQALLADLAQNQQLQKGQNAGLARPRASDRDSGMFGRIRAGVGSNTRSLLGAYPGDAASLSEAASPMGVLDIARRYGYGDWSDEDSDNDYRTKRAAGGSRSQGRSKRRPSSAMKRRKMRRRKDPVISFEFGVNLGPSGGGDSQALTSSRAGILRSSRRKQDRTSMLRNRSTQSEPANLTPALKLRKEENDAVPTRKNESRVNTRANESLHQDRHKAMQSPMSRLNELSSKSDRKLVRPAMERLSKIRENGKEN